MSLYVKLWTDILSDPKLMSAARKGARELQLLPWLLAFAKAADDDGRLTINGAPADPIDIAATIPSCTAKRVARAMDELERLGVLVRDGAAVLAFAAWERRAGAKPSDDAVAIRERVRKHRQKKHAEVTPGNALHVTPGNAIEVEEEVEQETEQESSSSSADAESDVARRLATDADRNALTALLVRVPNAETWLASMRASLDGMPGHFRVTPQQLGQALRDYAANGAPPNGRLFRRYLESAKRESDGPPAGAGAMPRRGGVAARTFANAQHALRDLP